MCASVLILKDRPSLLWLKSFYMLLRSWASLHVFYIEHKHYITSMLPRLLVGETSLLYQKRSYFKYKYIAQFPFPSFGALIVLEFLPHSIPLPCSSKAVGSALCLLLTSSFLTGVFEGGCVGTCLQMRMYEYFREKNLFDIWGQRSSKTWE